MIEYAKMTGEVEGNLIQVRMRTGECIFAPMVVVGTSATVPSKEWVTENKDSFLALITYEGQDYNDPMMIGFFPVKGADSSVYNTTDRMFKMLYKLIEQLLKAKVNTQIGPQPFMPDTITVFNEVKTELDEIQKLMSDLKK